jgi:type I restriction enzyme S subunit
MRQNYKRLGDYIQLVNIRDVNIQVDKLLGVSIQKKFIPSIANIIGTDMSTYKIIKKSQFAYGPVTSRNGDKISIALLVEYDEAIVSQAYTVFEITDTTQLLPEYLMMWFRRPEFDRYARYKSHGSAREIFDWNEMCETLLPVPTPEKQRQLEKEYNVIVDRINLNNRLIQKLEETAQAVYKEWFVEGIDKENLPEGWRVGELQELILFKNGKTRPTSTGNYPVYGGNGIVEYINEFNDENIIAIGRVGAYCGSLYRVLGKCWISDNAISATSRNNSNMFAFYTLSSLNLNERSEGTGQPLITQGLLNGIKIIVPSNEIIDDFEKIAIALFKNHDLIIQELEKLEDLKNLLLSKLATIEN